MACSPRGEAATSPLLDGLTIAVTAMFDFAQGIAVRSIGTETRPRWWRSRCGAKRQPGSGRGMMIEGGLEMAQGDVLPSEKREYRERQPA